jgi:hypothetical protein
VLRRWIIWWWLVVVVVVVMLLPALKLEVVAVALVDLEQAQL